MTWVVPSHKESIDRYALARTCNGFLTAACRQAAGSALAPAESRLRSVDSRRLAKGEIVTPVHREASESEAQEHARKVIGLGRGDDQGSHLNHAFPGAGRGEGRRVE